MCRIPLERCTGPQTENVMRHQRPPGAYQTDDWSLTDVVLAPSTEMRPAANASSWGGGQVKKKYLDKSVTVCLMHTKNRCRERGFKAVALACFARPLAVFVCLLCLVLPTSLFVFDCASNFYLPVYLRDARRRVGERLRDSYKILNWKCVFTHQSDQLKSLNVMAYRLHERTVSLCLEENDNPSRCGFKPHPGDTAMKLMVSASASRLLSSAPLNFLVSGYPDCSLQHNWSKMISVANKYINTTDRAAQGRKMRSRWQEETNIKEQTRQTKESQRSVEEEQTEEMKDGWESRQNLERTTREGNAIKWGEWQGLYKSPAQNSCSILEATMAADWVGQGSQRRTFAEQS